MHRLAFRRKALQKQGFLLLATFALRLVAALSVQRLQRFLQRAGIGVVFTCLIVVGVGYLEIMSLGNLT